MIDFEMNFAKDITDFLRSINLDFKKSDVLFLTAGEGRWLEAFKRRGYLKITGILKEEEGLVYPNEGFKVINTDLENLIVDFDTKFGLIFLLEDDLDRLKTSLGNCSTNYYIITYPRNKIREIMQTMSKRHYRLHSIVNKPFTVDEETVTLFFYSELQGLYSPYSPYNIQYIYGG